MGKKERNRRRVEARTRGPAVHVKVASAEGDLLAATQLVKPAILYADKVTIFSPAASLVSAALHVLDARNPRARVEAVIEVIRDVPSMADQLGQVDPSVLGQLGQFIALPRNQIRRLTQRMGVDDTEFFAALDEMERVFREDVPEALEGVIETAKAKDLLGAIKAGAVEIAPVSEATHSELIAQSVNAALGHTSPGTDEMVAGFVARIVEMVGDATAFPLLDADSSGLLRAMEEGAGVDLSSEAMRRGSEVTASTRFMGFLPYFTEMPMDEVLDLRTRIDAPLIRFRGAMVGISKDFASRPIDEGFDAEVESAWRGQVEPALVEIRENLHDHGLLREVRSIAMGDPRRMMLEAGGVLAAARTDVLSLSHLLSFALAAGLPATDVVLRAVKNMQGARKEDRQNAFYFLHRVGETAQQSAED